MSFLRHASVNKLSLTFKIDFAISNCFCVDFRESLKPNQSFELRLLSWISCLLVCHPVDVVNDARLPKHVRYIQGVPTSLE